MCTSVVVTIDSYTIKQYLLLRTVLTLVLLPIKFDKISSTLRKKRGKSAHGRMFYETCVGN